MDFKVDIQDQQKTIHVSCSGVLDRDIFHKIIDMAIESLETTGFKKLVVDHSNSTVSELSNDAIRSIAYECVKLNDALEGGRLTIILSGDLDYGLGRVWHAQASNILKFESMVFRDAKEAIEWTNSSST